MADYTYTAGQTIRFGRKDTELTHLWDFGDGNTSALSNPFHTYSSLGTYNVIHTAWNICGTCVGGLTHTVDIVSDLSAPSTSDYKFQLGEEVHFNRRDTELTHLWDFGNGDTSTSPDLYYIYTIPGIYTVTHTAWNMCGTCLGGVSHTVEILPPPGNLDASSSPSGAKIFVDNIDTGLTTPSAIPNLPPGTHTIKLTLTGFQDYTTTVTIVSGETTYVSTTFMIAEEVPTCTTTPKHSGDIITLQLTPTGGIGPYTVEFRKDDVVIDPSLLLDEFGVPSISNPLTDVSEDILLTRKYTLTDTDIAAATTGTIKFSVIATDSCPTGPLSCDQYCDITIECVAPVCNFTVN